MKRIFYQIDGVIQVDYNAIREMAVEYGYPISELDLLVRASQGIRKEVSYE